MIDYIIRIKWIFSNVVSCYSTQHSNIVILATTKPPAPGLESARRARSSGCRFLLFCYGAMFISEGGMIRLETLIALKLFNSSCSSLSSY